MEYATYQCAVQGPIYLVRPFVLVAASKSFFFSAGRQGFFKRGGGGYGASLGAVPSAQT